MSFIQRTIQVSWPLRVFFTENVFAPANPVLEQALADGQPHQALVALDAGLAQARPELARAIEDYFRPRAAALRLVCPPVLVPGGEAAKNSPAVLRRLLARVHAARLDRHSYLLAVGGGALLDVAGFAAATAHRGVRHARLPTTTLSQADSGVGVKNGINAFGKKNFLGSFAPPHAVINDFNLLRTLAPRHQRGGWVEAVKVACIRDAGFFAELEARADRLAAFEPEAVQQLIRRCATLHLDHIAGAGDPFELGSARPLDFGHWAAHKLEQLSGFALPHGDAVAIGLALDVVYSRRIGWLAAGAADRILALLHRLGFVTWSGLLQATDTGGHPRILAGLEEFREHLGGQLTITLLRDIGQGAETHAMQPEIVLAAIRELQQRG